MTTTLADTQKTQITVNQYDLLGLIVYTVFSSCLLFST